MELSFRTERIHLVRRNFSSTLQVYWNHCLLSLDICFIALLCFHICLSVPHSLSLVFWFCGWDFWYFFVSLFGNRTTFCSGFEQHLWSCSLWPRTRITGLQWVTTVLGATTAEAATAACLSEDKISLFSTCFCWLQPKDGSILLSIGVWALQVFTGCNSTLSETKQKTAISDRVVRISL